jgi:hypothetical protein
VRWSFWTSVAALAVAITLGPAAPAAAAPPPPMPPPKFDEASAWLNVGALGSASSRGVGIGAELTLDWVGDMLSDAPWAQKAGIGLLLQLERISDGATRYVAGGQVIAGEIAGLEVAGVWRRRSAGNNSALHLAPFLAMGVASLAVFVDIPVGSDLGTSNPIEVGVAITIKIPIPLNGDYPIRKVGG